jgi:hypothetical protein
VRGNIFQKCTIVCKHFQIFQNFTFFNSKFHYWVVKIRMFSISSLNVKESVSKVDHPKIPSGSSFIAASRSHSWLERIAQRECPRALCGRSAQFRPHAATALSRRCIAGGRRSMHFVRIRFEVVGMSRLENTRMPDVKRKVRPELERPRLKITQSPEQP